MYKKERIIIRYVCKNHGGEKYGIKQNYPAILWNKNSTYILCLLLEQIECRPYRIILLDLSSDKELL